MASNCISIRGARTHNLKNVSIDIPRNKLVVITGLSGSGKSSLAFDTLYAEGQRRYAESVSSYARRFMDVMDKPDVDAIEGLSPSIAIEQHTSTAGSRSTVGTMTEINDYLRILFARAGTPYCPEHDVALRKEGIHDMVDAALKKPEGTRLMVLAPLNVLPGRAVQEEAGEGHEREGAFSLKGQTIGQTVKWLQRKGYLRVRIDGVVMTLDEVGLDLLDTLAENHRVDVVLDRLKAEDKNRTRLAESFEAAVKLADGRAILADLASDEDTAFSTRYACPQCGRTMPEMTPAMFSFNNALGACPLCEGAGKIERFDPQLVVRDATLTLRQGAVCGCTPQNRATFTALADAARVMGFSLDVPYETLPADVKDMILYGAKAGSPVAFTGIITELERKWKSVRSEAVKTGMRVLRRTLACPACGGTRHRAEVRHIYIGEGPDRINLIELQALSLDEVHARLGKLTFEPLQQEVARPLIEEVQKRVGFLIDVGLSYLTLSRSTATLSGGELQRIRLAGQISAGLTGVTYVLDEPTIGLHQRDTAKVIGMLKKLVAADNTVVVVEHDAEVIRAADFLIDMGPGAGVNGGSVICAGTPAEVAKNPDSRTGRYLAGSTEAAEELKKSIRVFTAEDPALVVRGACGHNLKNLTCRFPVGALSVVTGVSGSGKSTLINDTLANHLRRRFHKAKVEALDFEDIEGVDNFDKVIEVDQSPIGKTPRSNPATYTGLMAAIRDVFAQTPAALERGYGPGRFTFNSEGGCCETCQGEGQIKFEMGFLPAVYVTCPTCHGRRYNRETLEVKYRGKSIADVLDMTVDEAREFFAAYPAIERRLATLSEVGLGYIGLGQSAITFSGGEAQRIKLAQELARRDTGRTLYILDEPTTGLHFDDVAALMTVLRKLTALGNTVIVIEHDLDVVALADWVVDIGPEGGSGGGNLVFEGRPADLAKCPQSITGRFLAAHLGIDAAGKKTAEKTARTTAKTTKKPRASSAAKPAAKTVKASAK